MLDQAVQKGVKLMIDAEHSYFQPAIDHLTLRLMKQYNVGGRAVIYNTYQAYLVNTHKRLCDDMERAQREGYRFACKLVGVITGTYSSIFECECNFFRYSFLKFYNGESSIYICF